MEGLIYLTIDHYNNKVYVGQQTNKKLNYLGSGKIIKSVIKKRKHLLEKRILGYCETKEELDLAEQECIKFYDAQNPIYGYNITAGGEGHKKQHSDETKQKIRMSLLGHKRSLESIKKQSVSNLGQKRPKIRLAHLGKKRGPMSEETKLKISFGNKGKKRSAEVKAKIGELSRNREHKPLSEEQKNKISIALTGRKFGPRGPYKKKIKGGKI